MVGRTSASYQTLICLFTFIVVGEVLCQGRESPERLQKSSGRTRAISIDTAQNNNANTIDRPLKQVENKEPSKQTTPILPFSIKDVLFNSSSCIEPPFTCPHPRIKFFLYTRLTQNDPEVLDVTDPGSLNASRFDPERPVKIIVHGYRGGKNLSPMTDLRDAYFARGDYNVIIADYSGLAQIPCLGQMEWAPGFCGMCIAQLANYLADHPRGVPLEKLHLMGYSAGAHIAGLTSNYVKSGKLGRITGLDPTIIFYISNDRSKDLDPSDALFVDVIHTAAGTLGQWSPSGHADFYVNGGASQPGCAGDSVIESLKCDHYTVMPYFIESINTNVGFWALPCSNRFYFNLGLCNPPESDYALMGEHISHKARGTFYLKTNAKIPYAKGIPKKPN